MVNVMTNLSDLPSRTITLNLSEEASTVVRELAVERDLSVADLIREAIALYRFIYRKLREGAQIDLSYPDGSRERVRFRFAP